MFFHVLAAIGAGVLLWAVLTERYPPMPEVPAVEDRWFGPGSRPAKEDAAVNPFKIKVHNKTLVDLKHRLELDLARLSKPLEDSAFTYGFNTDHLRKVADHWLKKYDWRAEERKLNSLPQFMTTIDGVDVHFVHAKPKEVPKGKAVLPLLIVHGWPGSFVEFAKVIPMLTEASAERDFVFEVVAPSIPGYGFSSAPAQKGFDASQCARIFRRLMRERLGFQTYYTQGGDWGSLITSNMAVLYPESIRGLHLNMAMPNSLGVAVKQMLASVLPAGWVVPEEDLPKFLPMGKKFSEMVFEMGYLHLQATKPDTVGVALSNSPLGLGAYILEKFSTWTDKAGRDAADGLLTKKFAMDELLTNVMIYWVSGSITSSMRFYAENLDFSEEKLNMMRIPTSVPAGIVDADNELAHSPRSLLEHKYHNIVQFTDGVKGGHFFAMEEPAALAKDVFSFVAKVEELSKRKSSGKSEL